MQMKVRPELTERVQAGLKATRSGKELTLMPGESGWYFRKIWCTNEERLFCQACNEWLADELAKVETRTIDSIGGIVAAPGFTDLSQPNQREIRLYRYETEVYTPRYVLDIDDVVGCSDILYSVLDGCVASLKHWISHSYPVAPCKIVQADFAFIREAFFLSVFARLVPYLEKTDDKTGNGAGQRGTPAGVPQAVSLEEGVRG